MGQRELYAQTNWLTLSNEKANILSSKTQCLTAEEDFCATGQLSSAVFLADHLLETSPAAPLGKKCGKGTVKRGPDYYRKIAAMRKIHACGRPPSKAKLNRP
jgi:hypothetical protein